MPFPLTMFSNFERDLHRRMMETVEIDVDTLLVKVLTDLPAPADLGTRELKLHSVQSYISPGKMLKGSKFSAIAVSAFAVHWGVVVGRTLYHLVFQDEEDSQLEWSDVSRQGKPIRVAAQLLKSGTACDQYPTVGHTPFNHEERVKIADRLIEAFGDYHRLFWNCQVFAECFLRIITGNKHSGFSR